jgi:riboflavin kinase / FMN adenylyltransferase
MKVIENVLEGTTTCPNVVLTIGSFDGVHLGHQRILSEVTEAAHATNGTPAVMTLKPHPREVFSPTHAPNLLTSHKKKLELLGQAGIETVFVLPFTEATAGLSPQVFFDTVIIERCRAAHLVVGHDFRFGNKARGDYDLLVEMGRGEGVAVTQVPPLLIGGERVSSTAIRERILEGDLENAEEYLGRKYAMTGKVVTGRHIGAALGYPTANVKPHHSAVPPHGVYACEVRLGGESHLAAVNIGIAPTIRHEDITIEAHLLDFSRDIVGAEIEVAFHARLRPERRYPSREALVEQISKDVGEVRDYFDAQ